MVMKRPSRSINLQRLSTVELVGEMFNRSSDPQIAAQLEKLAPGSVEWWRLTTAERAALVEQVVSAIEHFNSDPDVDAH